MIATKSVSKATVYFSLSFVLLAASVVYGLLKWRIYSAQSAAILTNESQIVQILNDTEKAKTLFNDLAQERKDVRLQLFKKLDTILPANEHYTDLTRQLDAYFAESDKPGNPIFQSTLGFGDGIEQSDLPGISVLPFTMNIDATRDNFYKFLDFVKNSGSLQNGVRILEITSIQLNFPEEGEVVKDPAQKLNFTVDMNAFYRTPPKT